MIKCLCIDDQYKPETIPDSMWIKEGQWYHITWIYYHKLQGIQGVDLKEVAIKGCPPYESYRLDRFAFTEDGIKALIKMLSECTDANNVDIEKLIEESQLQTVEE